MAQEDMHGWLPIRAWLNDGEWRVDWCWFGEQRLIQPFYRDEVDLALRLPFNQAFRRDTPLAALLGWTAASPGLPPTVFIFHASRCGSTLLAQMLARLDSHIVLSEPPPLDQLLRAHYASRLGGAEQNAAIGAMLSALGQRRDSQASRLVVKLDAWNLYELPLLHRCFPDTPWLSLYRDPLEIAASHLQQPGMHMVPGLIGESPLHQADEAPTPREEFIARRLGRLLQAAADLHRQHGGLLLNYSELPMALGGRLRTMFGLEAGQIAAALEGSGLNAKRPEQAFAADTQRKRDGASTLLREAVSRWAEAPYRDLEALRLQQQG
ncbi:aspartyl beta-hydroxylase [Pseudomonas taeanensis MS-3]|uniref:Aspartyl beta-hydroxylase n=1 Tax=Pseudomonas taeanensis MS-3 TaxID=1395571 RepID=A0A0A1YK15_9PSED|nr:aspartyl beta-hydroxylase [Pseudomonas taeanensis]KFX69308.1 aspartyl beta-hydroxylase [Pseudomonas taeanensis MS-3]